MSQTYYVEIPVQISPRLRGGKIHKMQITTAGITITTWSGLYGNRESRCVLGVASEQITSIHYQPPLLANGDGKCEARYVDAAGQERKLTIHVVDQGVLAGNLAAQARQNTYTETLTEVLLGLQHGSNKLPELPNLTLKIPNASKKLLYGTGTVILIGVLSAGAAAFDKHFLAVFSPFILWMGIGALGIDYVRVHTGWHPLIKLLVAVVIIFIVFVTLVGVILWLEAQGII